MKRRQFLESAAALGLGANLAPWPILEAITPANAAEMAIGPDAVTFRPEIEPIVRWIEETPRGKIIEIAARELKEGLSYRDLMAGIFLAGIRNVKPRPVGFKFHTVLSLNSAHTMSLAADPEDRLLPMFWALDNFKGSQERDIQEGDWTLSKVDEAKVPKPGKARQALIDALDAWDEEGADVATAGLCRSAGAAETMEVFWRYATRDQRDIGHKAIFAMQCWRTLQTIGWSHAEPVLRSLAFGMLDLGGDKRKAEIGPYETNLKNAAAIRPDWMIGKSDDGTTVALLEIARQASPEEASSQVVKLLNQGAAPDGLWDAMLLAAHELLMRKPGILSLHTITGFNALHYVYQTSGDDTTRKLALLQAAGWFPIFRDRVSGKDGVRIDDLKPIEPKAADAEGLADAFAAINDDRNQAVSKALGWLNKGGTADALHAAARRLILRKGRDSHDYKFGAASWEEALLVSSPRWRAPMAAAALFNFPGAKTPDSGLITRAVEAVKA